MNASVARQLLGKLGGLLLTLFLSSVVIFSAVLLTPGDPVVALAGGVRPTPEMIEAIKAAHHLDQPVWVQYLYWIGGVLTGDLGTSFVYKTPVTELIAPRFGVTLLLVLYTIVLIAIFGIGSGILAATRGRGTDRAVLVATSFGVALPTFVVAILLIWVFGRVLGLFPVYGAGEGLLDNLYHLTLPAISLSVLYIAYLSRITRGAVVGQLHSEHVDTARVRGIPRSQIFRRHVFLNASPQILAISGATVAGLFAASAIAEQAFGIGGLGSLLTEAAARKDLPVVQAISLLLVILFVVLNAAADVAIALIDPDSVKPRRTA
ncbi:peptide/nickel transport system permease protein [Microbacterium trichothecenolyticum]|uniref:ABC transporter permease n=1 Tax=Microbacterium trichothecenolyticum TaxID=69370 RepID=UPI00285F4E9D|nr:ABC transporter permease [Microbacterium trichothecenolyticum]MDR7183515.1 peptide/nickel transport system permease protein [Microbacterium trichothecenolyticum]